MNGYVITSKQPGYKQLFLPGYNGCYWTNELKGAYGMFAAVLAFDNERIYIDDRDIHLACSIRPVHGLNQLK